MIRQIRFAFVMATAFGASAQADTLTDALRSGLAQSDSLTAARLSYSATVQTLPQATAENDLTGTVTVTGSHTESDNRHKSGGFASSQSFSTKVGISKRLYDSGEGDARLQAARYNVESRRASYRAQEQGVILSIVTAYLNLLTATDAKLLQEDNVARLTAQTEATKIRLEAGTTTATRLSEAEARLARARSNLIAAQNDEETARDEYHSLTGLSGDSLSLPAMDMTLPTSLVAAEELAIAHHPDMQSAALAERSARVQFDVLARTVLPKVNFTLSATDSYGKGNMNDKLDVKGQIVLTSPFLVTPSSRAKGRETSANLERAKYLLADARRKVTLDARSSLRSLRAAQAQKQAVEAELNAAMLVAEGIAAEVEFGQKIFLDQLDAEQSVSDARVRLLRAEQAIMINRYRLLASVGKLDLDAVGLSGELETLDNMPAPRDVFTGALPLAELPE